MHGNSNKYLPDVRSNDIDVLVMCESNDTESDAELPVLHEFVLLLYHEYQYRLRLDLQLSGFK